MVDRVEIPLHDHPRDPHARKGQWPKRVSEPHSAVHTTLHSVKPEHPKERPQSKIVQLRVRRQVIRSVEADNTCVYILCAVDVREKWMSWWRIRPLEGDECGRSGHQIADDSMNVGCESLLLHSLSASVVKLFLSLLSTRQNRSLT